MIKNVYIHTCLRMFTHIFFLYISIYIFLQYMFLIHVAVFIMSICDLICIFFIFLDIITLFLYILYKKKVLLQ